MQDVSFEVHPGETLAIIGNTGSGKSTLLELISRLYEVEQGSYKVDGILAKDQHLEELRQSSSDSLEAIFSQLTGFTETNTNTDDFLEAFQNKDNA